MSACKIFKIAKKPIAKKTKDTTAVAAIPKVDTVKGPATVLPAPAVGSEKKELIANLEPLWDKQVDFNTFSGKVKMHYEGAGQKLEFTAHIRMKKDSVIWVIITAMGGFVQVGRVFITPDSFMMVNYINKTATEMPLSEASKFLPTKVDFPILQNFILGNALVKKGTITDATDFGGTLSIQVESKNYIQQVAYNKADSTMRLAQMRTRDNDGPQGMTQYGGYDMIDGRKFSTNRVVNIQNMGQHYLLNMNFTSADFNKDQDYPFEVPQSFTMSNGKP